MFLKSNLKQESSLAHGVTCYRNLFGTDMRWRGGLLSCTKGGVWKDVTFGMERVSWSVSDDCLGHNIKDVSFLEQTLVVKLIGVLPVLGTQIKVHAT